MKKWLNDLNKAFDNKTRLGIMSALQVNDSLDFTELKDLLGLTDGNLASHLKALEKNEFVSVQKSFVGRKPNTRYSSTKEGMEAFQKHLNALEMIIKNMQ